MVSNWLAKLDSRSLAYSVAYSKAASLIPSACAAIPILPIFRLCHRNFKALSLPHLTAVSYQLYNVQR